MIWYCFSGVLACLFQIVDVVDRYLYVYSRGGGIVGVSYVLRFGAAARKARVVSCIWSSYQSIADGRGLLRTLILLGLVWCFVHGYRTGLPAMVR